MKGSKKTATTAIDRRAILRCVSDSCDFAVKFKQKAGVTASVSTFRRVINSANHLKRLKLQKKPPLNEQRKGMRLEFFRLHMSWKNEWHHVVFSDEKKFKFHGSDSCNYYFHDVRKEERFLARHHSREGRVMVWGSVNYYETVELEVQKSKMSAFTHKGILKRNFPKFADI